MASLEGSASDESSAPSPPSDVQEAARESAGWRMRRAANAFLWVALLSLLHSSLVVIGGGVSYLEASSWFALGFAVSSSVMATALDAGDGSTALWVAFGLGTVASAVIAPFRWWARGGWVGAFAVGMALYALDGVLSALAQEWIGVAFHLFVLYRLYQGARAAAILRAAHAPAD